MAMGKGKFFRDETGLIISHCEWVKICSRWVVPQEPQAQNTWCMRTMMQGWYYVKSLTGQRHDRVQLKANNCNRGQLFRPYWVSSARRSKLYEVFSWLTDIHILTMRWWWPQMELESKFLPIGQCHMQNAWQGTIGKIQNIMSLSR